MHDMVWQIKTHCGTCNTIDILVLTFHLKHSRNIKSFYSIQPNVSAARDFINSRQSEYKWLVSIQLTQALAAEMCTSDQ